MYILANDQVCHQTTVDKLVNTDKRLAKFEKTFGAYDIGQKLYPRTGNNSPLYFATLYKILEKRCASSIVKMYWLILVSN